MRGDRRVRQTLRVALAAAAALAAAGGASAGLPPVVGGTVGIRVSVASLDPTVRSADLDLTMYTRGFGPYGYAGTPFYGLPALDYGDGNTLATATLALTTTGGGPGGSSVYRSLASFSHSYPTLAAFKVTGAMACVLCVRSSYAFFPQGSPVPTAFTSSIDFVPTSVIGNLAATYRYSGTNSTYFSSYSVRYAFTYYLAVTNTAAVVFNPLDVPATSGWGLVLLGAALSTTGVLLLRRL